MRYKALIFALLGLLLSSCARRMSMPDEVVDETYIHRYGVQVEPAEWSTKHGETGQVRSSLKNGVVVTRTYASGALEGETTYTYPHSDLIEKREIYSQGNLQKVTTYYKNGSPKDETKFETDASRTVLAWYENGAARSNETLLDGFLVKGDYYTITHALDSSVKDKNGQRTRRDPFGHLVGVDTIKDGTVTLTKTFFPNGAIKQEVPFQNGEIDGQLKTFLPDGQPASIETWTLGEKTGATILFENGEKVAEVPFVRGVKDGTEKRFREGRAVVEEISWMQDLRHGPTTATIGGVKKTDYYYQGKLVPKSVFEKMTNGVTSSSTLR